MKLLTEGTGNILDMEDLVATLDQSRTLSPEINNLRDQHIKLSEVINSNKENFRPVAKRAAILFKATSEMVHIDPIY